MSTIDYLLIAIIFVLATLLGYFLHKALQAQRIRQLELDLIDQERIKDTLAQTQRDLDRIETDYKNLLAKEDQLRKDYYQLTLRYKDLQDEFRANEEALNKRVYEVPPQLAHIEESNVLLSSEIRRLRTKIKKLKSKDFYKENKRLKHKVRKEKARLLKLKAKSLHKKKLARYEHLYKQIMTLSEEAKILVDKTEMASRLAKDEISFVKAPKLSKPSKPEESKKSSKKEKKSKKKKSSKKKDKNIFRKQPDFKKRQLFRELVAPKEKGKIQAKADVGAFDLERAMEKSLMDLAGMDVKAYAALYNEGIKTFEELSVTKIAEVRLILEKAGLSSESYHHATWPIQADLARKGKWDVIQDYKDRIDNQNQ